MQPIDLCADRFALSAPLQDPFGELAHDQKEREDQKHDSRGHLLGQLRKGMLRICEDLVILNLFNRVFEDLRIAVNPRTHDYVKEGPDAH